MSHLVFSFLLFTLLHTQIMFPGQKRPENILLKQFTYFLSLI